MNNLVALTVPTAIVFLTILVIERGGKINFIWNGLKNSFTIEGKQTLTNTNDCLPDEDSSHI